MYMYCLSLRCDFKGSTCFVADSIHPSTPWWIFIHTPAQFSFAHVPLLWAFLWWSKCTIALSKMFWMNIPPLQTSMFTCTKHYASLVLPTSSALLEGLTDLPLVSSNHLCLIEEPSHLHLHYHNPLIHIRQCEFSTAEDLTGHLLPSSYSWCYVNGQIPSLSFILPHTTLFQSTIFYLLVL